MDPPRTPGSRRHRPRHAPLRRPPEPDDRRRAPPWASRPGNAAASSPASTGSARCRSSRSSGTTPAAGRSPITGLDRGFLGVDFFFAISGFLIVTLLLRERDRHGRISLRGFYARRSLRIFPVYYAFLAAMAAAYLLLAAGGPGHPRHRRERPVGRAVPLQRRADLRGDPGAHLVAGHRGAVLPALGAGGEVAPAVRRPRPARGGDRAVAGGELRPLRRLARADLRDRRSDRRGEPPPRVRDDAAADRPGRRARPRDARPARLRRRPADRRLPLRARGLGAAARRGRVRGARRRAGRRPTAGAAGDGAAARGAPAPRRRAAGPRAPLPAAGPAGGGQLRRVPVPQAGDRGRRGGVRPGGPARPRSRPARCGGADRGARCWRRGSSRSCRSASSRPRSCG